MREYTPGSVPQELKELVAFLDSELASLAATLSQPKHILPTLLNSWTNLGSGYAPAGFYKDGLGRVHLRGVLVPGTTTNGTPLFVVPLGFRPATIQSLPGFGGDPHQQLQIDVRPSGSVEVRSATGVDWISLCGLSFPVGT